MLPSLKVRLLSVLREWSSITEMGGGGGGCLCKTGGGRSGELFTLKKKQGAEVEKVSAMLDGGGGGHKTF